MAEKRKKIFPFSSLVYLTLFLLAIYVYKNPDTKDKVKPYAKISYAYALNLKDLIETPFYKHVSGYSIKLPNKYTVHGIDVSHHQQYIDWSRVSKMHAQGQSIKFAYCKATEGLDHSDRHFSHNKKRSKEHQISFGAYHFFRPKKDGKQQADFFLNTVGDLAPADMVPVVDIEVLDRVSPSTMRKRLKDFLDHVESAIGVKPMIYTGDVFYKDYLKGYFPKYRIWIANYSNGTQSSEKRWTMWQHSQTATVDGIPGKVDMNVFYGNWEQFKKAMLIGFQ
ncbi:glycoside hydrolase family 25 protein [Flammeovirga yaeyamensis]|uniref:Glycoside hydrolase family 25 protein n=1 Tax=Flammeovirga yaeyamensis TaxID=367791 RepID=A0AAX1NB65_9BACT|nr:GH25 family lysozyme [Flammeovirga yaeyamensis]MBB3699877.1 lysozyme [Flammeovirga yaeyamensis]NMF38326.1 glycoside hydrolase family 25 protein [Flammeovirga yaeyamensis]QWG04737.1 glycoside hydrolase family 25 protein [Flammeovirga yaeyamensis]